MLRSARSRLVASLDDADLQKPTGSSGKRKREHEHDAPAAKGRRGAAQKPKQDFEKIVTDAETNLKVWTFCGYG